MTWRPRPPSVATGLGARPPSGGRRRPLNPSLVLETGKRRHPAAASGPSLCPVPLWRQPPRPYSATASGSRFCARRQRTALPRERFEMGFCSSGRIDSIPSVYRGTSPHRRAPQEQKTTRCVFPFASTAPFLRPQARRPRLAPLIPILAPAHRRGPNRVCQNPIPPRRVALRRRSCCPKSDFVCAEAPSEAQGGAAAGLSRVFEILCLAARFLRWSLGPPHSL